MRFKNVLLSLSAILALASLLAGCGDMTSDNPDEHVIGSKLEAVSPMRAADGSNNANIAVFDEKLRKIHQFDVVHMKKIKTLKVQNPAEMHYVAYDTIGNYIVDMSLKGLSIFDSTGREQINPVKLQGKPKSAAFRPQQGYLVLYDELMSVGMIKLSTSGEVLSKIALGPILGDDGATIVAGDISADGRLVLSLSDSSLALVNMEQSIAQKRWSFTRVNVPKGPYVWIAPLRDDPHRMMMKNSTSVAIVDLDSGVEVSKINISGEVKKLSKEIDPHVVTARSSNNEVTLIYARGGILRSHIMYRQIEDLAKSQLDLAGNEWKILRGSSRYIWDIFTNEANLVKSDRRLEIFSVTDLLAQGARTIADSAQVYLGSDYVFELYPSDLGHAIRHDNVTDQKTVLDNFNVREY